MPSEESPSQSLHSLVLYILACQSPAERGGGTARLAASPWRQHRELLLFSSSMFPPLAKLQEYSAPIAAAQIQVKISKKDGKEDLQDKLDNGTVKRGQAWVYKRT